MSRYFTHYWLNRTWEYNQKDTSDGDPLDHIAGNLFRQRGVRVGDIVYVVTVMKGSLYVCGKLMVGKICSSDEAAVILGREDLWEADEHIVSSAATPMNFDLEMPLKVTQRLRFISGDGIKPLNFKSPGYLDGQTLRGVRELEPASAAELDSLLPPLEELSFDESSGFPPLDDEETFPEEVADTQTYYEGATKQVKVNKYERSAGARKVCIARYGVSCFICGFNFKDFYGNDGEGFIHVHHLKPLSDIGEEYKLDPVKDLRPVCPNCHAMIHKRVPAYTIEEMKQLLYRNKTKPA